MNRNPDFITFCGRHRFEIHDGSKNECCDQGSVIPLLEVNEIKSLTPQGVTTFHQDFSKLLEVIEQVGEDNLPAKASAWVKGIKVDLETVLAESQQTAEEEEGENVPGTLEETDDDGYFEHVFEQGFLAGYNKGFDMGARLMKKQ